MRNIAFWIVVLGCGSDSQAVSAPGGWTLALADPTQVDTAFQVPPGPRTTVGSIRVESDGTASHLQSEVTVDGYRLVQCGERGLQFTNDGSHGDFHADAAYIENSIAGELSPGQTFLLVASLSDGSTSTVVCTVTAVE